MSGAWPAHEGQGRQRSDACAREAPTARDARSRTSGLPCSGDNGSHCAAQTTLVHLSVASSGTRLVSRLASSLETWTQSGHVVQMPKCAAPTLVAPPIEHSESNARARVCDAQVHSILL